MQTLDRSSRLPSHWSSPIQRQGAARMPLSFPDANDRTFRHNLDAWNSVINDQLIEWGRSLREFEDDGICPPTPRAIQIAYSVAASLRDLTQPPPTEIVPTGDGGIAIRRRDGGRLTAFEIDADGHIEYYMLSGGQIQRRETIA